MPTYPLPMAQDCPLQASSRHGKTIPKATKFLRLLANYEISHRLHSIVASTLQKYLKQRDMTLLITAIVGMIAIILFVSIVDSVSDK